MATKRSKKKIKTRMAKDPTGSLPAGMQRTKVIRKPPEPKKGAETFTDMETGQPDRDALPDSRNPLAVQGGMGPLNEEGEGDRQNDQLAELEEIEPDLEPKEEA